MNPSAEDIAEAAKKVPAKNIFVFPNNKNISLAAEQANNLIDKNLIIIPTTSVPEGIASIISFNPDVSVEENHNIMNESMKSVRSGMVTYAVRDTQTDDFELRKGEIIGLDNKTILAKGNDISQTTIDLIEKMMTENVMNITLFYGEDVKEEDAQSLSEKLIEKYPDCEVTIALGGQPVYYYIVSLE